MKNLILVCKQCGNEFELTAQQEQTYAERGFDLPERCADCRKKKTKETVLSGRNKHPNKKKYYRLKYMVSP